MKINENIEDELQFNEEICTFLNVILSKFNIIDIDHNQSNHWSILLINSANLGSKFIVLCIIGFFNENNKIGLNWLIELIWYK